MNPILASLVALGLCAAPVPAADVPAGGKPPATAKYILTADDPVLAQDLKAVEDFLEAHTGLEFRQPVTIRKMTRDEIRQDALRQLAGEQAALRKEFTVLKALGLVTSIPAAERVYREFLDRSVTGFYRDKDRTLVVVATAELDLQILVHELHHALIDQHHGLKRLRGGPGDDKDAEMARLCLIEGTAMLAERVFEDWKSTRKAVPTRESLGRILAKVRREIGETYSPLAQEGSRAAERDLIQADLMFPYTWGLYHVAQQAADNLDRWSAWYGGLFAEERAPVSTRHVLHGTTVGGDTPERPQLDLADVADGWLKDNPDWKAVEKQGVCGELYIRLLSRRGLSAGVASERPALGLAADRFVVMEVPGETSPNAVTGVAVLVFDSEPQAEFHARWPGPEPKVGDHVTRPERVGRAVVVPLSACPRSLFDRATEKARGLRLPKRGVTADALFADLEMYRSSGQREHWDRLRDNLGRGEELTGAAADELGRQLFQPARDLRGPAEEDAARDVWLGKQLAALAGHLRPAARGALARAAVAALQGQAAAPAERLSAARFLVAARDDLSEDDRRQAVLAAEVAFENRPELARQLRQVLSPREVKK